MHSFDLQSRCGAILALFLPDYDPGSPPSPAVRLWRYQCEAGVWQFDPASFDKLRMR